MSSKIEMSAAQGVETLSVYDRVIRTQAEFEELIASPTWLDAVSVCFVGDGGTLKFTRSDGLGCKIPATVKQIQGVNAATIEVSNFTYLIENSRAAMWYNVIDNIQSCEISGLTVNCYGIGNTHVFYHCNKLTNCSGNCIGKNGGHAFYDCNKLTNCMGTASAPDEISIGNSSVFYRCKELNNCNALSKNYESFGFHTCTGLTNCTSTCEGMGGLGGTSCGFYSCDQLTNCNGDGNSAGNSMDADPANGYGFHTCTQLTNCNGRGKFLSLVGGEGYSFSNCAYLNGCKQKAKSTTAIFKGCTYIDYETNEGLSAAKKLNATLTAAGWTAGEPYVQEVSVGAISELGVLRMHLAQTATAQQRKAARHAMLYVTGQGDGTLTITADGVKPNIDIPIVVYVI